MNKVLDSKVLVGEQGVGESKVLVGEQGVGSELDVGR